MKRVDEQTAARPEARSAEAHGPTPLRPVERRTVPVERRTALLAGGGVLATALLSGCTGGGDDAKGGGPSTPAGLAPSASSAAPTTAPSRTAPPVKPDWPALAAALDGDLVRPTDAAYEVDHRLYNTRYDHLRPAGIAYVTGPGDIRTCLDFARRTGTPPAIRSGGHSYAGWSSGDGRLIIDVSRLNSIHLDGTVATVGAGARLIDLYNTLGQHGRTVPGGSCPSVAVSGLTLGGGHGVMSRSMGLTCDNLIGATLVTADGRTHEVSADAEPDVFWALRGAGNGNFGVVTSLRFSTHPVPEVVSGYLTWPWRRAAAVISAWQRWGPDQPDRVWSSLHLECAPGGSPTLSVAMLSSGSRDDLATAADALASAAGSDATSVSLRPHAYVDAMFSYAGCEGLSAAQCHLAPGGHLNRETYTARSDFYDANLPAGGVDAMVSQVQRLASRSGAGTGAGTGSIALTALGGAVNRVSPTATAFAHRGSRFLAQYIASNALADTSWLDTTYSALRRYSSGAAYQNYADPTLTDWRTAYYGPNAAKLATLKSRLDPNRLFTFPQAL